MHPAEWRERITCVEFPGYVNSTSRCLQALGEIPTVCLCCGVVISC